MLNRSFVCQMCGKKLCNKQSYSRHWNNIHNGKCQFNCSLCDKQFRRKDNLKNHIVRQHIAETKGYYRKKCEFCHKTVDKQKYKRHLLLMHRPRTDKMNDRVTINCSLCSAAFIHKSSLLSHKKEVHKVFPKMVRRIKCPMCGFMSENGSKSVIYTHFKLEHKILMNFETYHFVSIEEFYKWKRDIEKKTISHFRKNRKESNILTFKCHRSGRYKSKISKRNLKMAGSCKINGFCPAFINVKMLNTNDINVTYQAIHVGHKNELRYIPLAFEERKAIAIQLANNISCDEILKRIQGSLTTTPLQRIHLTNRKDIYNIKHSFDLNKIVAECSNDPNVKLIEQQLFCHTEPFDHVSLVNTEENYTSHLQSMAVASAADFSLNTESIDPVSKGPRSSTEDDVGNIIEEVVRNDNNSSKETVAHFVNISKEGIDHSVNVIDKITEEVFHPFLNITRNRVDNCVNVIEEAADYPILTNVPIEQTLGPDIIDIGLGFIDCNTEKVDAGDGITSQHASRKKCMAVSDSQHKSKEGFGNLFEFNDEYQIDRLIQKLKTSQNTSLVIYKQKGLSDSEFYTLAVNDTVLIYMTEKQRDFLVRGEHDVVCIDGTNCFNYFLYALLVPDETGEGFPIAFMFTNRSDKLTMKIFFEKIKEIVGDIKTVAFITNASETYCYLAWAEVMGEVNLHLYSSSNVLKNWRLNINNRITSNEKQNEVYNLLQDLLYEIDERKFHNRLEDCLINWNEDEDISEFHEYFYEMFILNNQVKKWAYCYRVHFNTNINLSVDVFSRVLVYCNLRSEKYKPFIDKLLNVIDLLQNKIFDIMGKVNKENISKKVHSLQVRHWNSYENGSEYVIQKEDKWIIFNYPNRLDSKVYTVKKVKNCNSCLILCGHCNSCFHEYVCTCLDHVIKNNMCKHIHLVARTQKLLLENNGEDCENSIEISTPDEAQIVTSDLVLKLI